ncbi:methyltransferase type 11 [Paraburkholderia acidicola]|uniref:Methyltransferase type 11 n=2 Tax=Paraburkholderia acidicola TaxID=1912599 RepID=A0A2A4EV69_9BURK|nr:methyltransferase type 11 [Paraburkholderia acidicola]
MRSMTATNTLYTDPRLVALYDTLNPFGADTGFYLALAASLRASHIVDIGCGTGLLTCELARRGHAVTGIDPARAMLDVARRRPGGERVQWIEGDAQQASDTQADLALMTGHVAQVFVDDLDWRATLAAAYRTLRPGGRLAFESRHPQSAPWKAWTPEASLRRISVDGDNTVKVWHELIEVSGECVRFVTHYQFDATGEELVSASELRFRSQSTLAQTLTDSGFSIAHWYGDWSGAPVDEQSRELIVIAVRD